MLCLEKVHLFSAYCHRYMCTVNKSNYITSAKTVYALASLNILCAAQLRHYQNRIAVAPPQSA